MTVRQLARVWENEWQRRNECQVFGSDGTIRMTVLHFRGFEARRGVFLILSAFSHPNVFGGQDARGDMLTTTAC